MKAKGKQAGFAVVMVGLILVNGYGCQSVAPDATDRHQAIQEAVYQQDSARAQRLLDSLQGRAPRVAAAPPTQDSTEQASPASRPASVPAQPQPSTQPTAAPSPTRADSTAPPPRVAEPTGDTAPDTSSSPTPDSAAPSTPEPEPDSLAPADTASSPAPSTAPPSDSTPSPATSAPDSTPAQPTRPDTTSNPLGGGAQLGYLPKPSAKRSFTPNQKRRTLNRALPIVKKLHTLAQQGASTPLRKESTSLDLLAIQSKAGLP